MKILKIILDIVVLVIFWAAAIGLGIIGASFFLKVFAGSGPLGFILMAYLVVHCSVAVISNHKSKKEGR